MKKITRRNFLKVTAASAAALGLAGCGGSKDNAASGAGNAAENKGYELEAVDVAKTTEVVLWHNRGGKAGELLEQTMIPKFNDTVGKEMGIKVTPVYQSSSDLISKAKALILAKDVDNLPDMIQAFAGDAEYMSTVPYVIPAQSLIEADESFDGSELMPQLVNSYTLADVLWSLPFHASTMVMYYNKTAYAKAGLDPETPATTLAEFADMAAKLKGDGQYAITLGIQNTYINHFIGGQGEYSFIGDHENGRAGRMTKVVFDEEGTMKNFLTEWSKVLATGPFKRPKKAPRHGMSSWLAPALRCSAATMCWKAWSTPLQSRVGSLAWPSCPRCWLRIRAVCARAVPPSMFWTAAMARRWQRAGHS